MAYISSVAVVCTISTSWMKSEGGAKMLDFPKSTEFNKRIPKQKFYEKIDVSPALKKVFVEQIKLMFLQRKPGKIILWDSPYAVRRRLTFALATMQ